MQTRRTFITTAFASVGFLATAVFTPVLAQDAMSRDDILGSVANQYVVSPDITNSERIRIHAQADRLEKMFTGTGAIIMRRKSEVVLSIPEQAFFAHPKPSVRPDVMPLLSELAAEMIKQPRTWLEIMAHYHSDGRAANSMASSERRGVAIQAVLMSRKVPLSRVIVSGLGEAYPSDTNSTPEGKSNNRRIDLVFRPVS